MPSKGVGAISGLGLTMLRPMTLVTFLMLSTLSFAPAHAGPSSDCEGEIEIQTDPQGNEWSCEGDCAGNIVVQVGLKNEIDCQGENCVGNVWVQTGLRNEIQNCLDSLRALATASAASHSPVDLADLSQEPPCPHPLPKENFWCYLADFAVGEADETVCEQQIIPRVCEAIDVNASMA